jgi:HSP20 family protein
VTSEDDRTQYSVRLPGAKPEDIDVTASSGVLTISGRRERQRQSRRGGYRWQERSVSTFSRSVALPEQADAEKAYGVIDRDVLRITVPHRQPSPPVNIKIDDAGNGD